MPGGPLERFPHCCSDAGIVEYRGKSIVLISKTIVVAILDALSDNY